MNFSSDARFSGKHRRRGIVEMKKREVKSQLTANGQGGGDTDGATSSRCGPLRSSGNFLTFRPFLLEKLTRRGRASARNKHLFKRSRQVTAIKYLRVVNLVFGRAGCSLMYNVFSPPRLKQSIRWNRQHAVLQGIKKRIHRVQCR